MQIAYDFHIHTAASPCGDEYMSPNNIVNMAKLNGLQAIAVTDHNSCANCEPILRIGEENEILVIPGMEIECMEEFHCIALFSNLKEAKEIERYIQESMPNIKNRVDIFGHQYQFNEKDEIIGEIDRLLLTATSLSAEELFKAVRQIGGVIYPAHIDRNSYSIISNLGFIPNELNVNVIEISKNASLAVYEQRFKDQIIMQSSDAHYLQDILEQSSFLNVEVLNRQGVLKSIKNNKE